MVRPAATDAAPAVGERLTEAEFLALSPQEMLERLAPHAKDDPRLAKALMRGLKSREANPLMWAAPHSDAQRVFVEAMTPVVAAFAGNRFGKSTALVWRALRECLPAAVLPEWLRACKHFDAPVHGWIVCPTEDKIFDPGGLKDTFEKWCPKGELKGRSWRTAFNGERMTISFECGSSLAFKTYKQDPSTLGGSGLHFVGYDEPPPRRHREECRMRLADYGGFEMFAMTPLATNTAYVRRVIWREREAPHITVVKGSIHDNPTLNAAAVELALGDLSDVWRRAREFGDFVEVGGMIYPEFERCVASEPWPPVLVRGWDIVVSIDPGIRNAGIVLVGFDDENVAHVFDASLLQDSTAAQYAAEVRRMLGRWGLSTASPNVFFVADPAARQRDKTNALTVLAALSEQGIDAAPGQNDVQAGIAQLRMRMAHRRFWVSPERNPGLLGLRDEADEYAAREPKEGSDDSHMEPVKSNDHRLDALRYAVMERFFDPLPEELAPRRMLGWVPGSAPALSGVVVAPEFGPMGALS